HTRSDRDWSSDVCSSDLITIDALHAVHEPQGVIGGSAADAHQPTANQVLIRVRRTDDEDPFREDVKLNRQMVRAAAAKQPRMPQIGRASCRERVEDASRA